MTKVDFCTRLCANPYAEWEITINSGEVIRGMIDEIKDDYVIIDESCAFGDMCIVNFEDIAGMGMSPQYER